MIAVLYQTKKALKDAIGKSLRYQETSMYGNELVPEKAVPFVGPSAYERKFYGTIVVDREFKIVSVK